MKIDGSRKNEIRDFVKTVKSLSQKKKNQIYWKRYLAEKLKMKQKNKKVDFLTCY